MIFIILGILGFANVCFLTIMMVSQVSNLTKKWNSLNGLKETRITLAFLTIALWLTSIYNVLKDAYHITTGDAGDLAWLGFLTRFIVLIAIIRLYYLFKNSDE